MTNARAAGDQANVDRVFGIVEEILEGMGITEIATDSMMAAPPFYEGEVLIKRSDRFALFAGQFSLKVGCIPYAFNDAALLTVRQFCEMYIADSEPEIPSVALSEDQYVIHNEPKAGHDLGPEQEFPIGFVLGCARSGTTLFRTMLNVHQDVWAPGELHLANYESMKHRAARIVPLLRFMIIPECAARFGEPVSAFSLRFKQWERDDLPMSEVYRRLYEADPSRLIIDKTPPYSHRLAYLQEISRRFPNAKFIHLIRSPHDVIRSYVKMGLYKRGSASFEPGLNPYQMGEVTWSLHNANIAQFLKQVPSARQCTVRYEDLVAAPDEWLTKVCRTLDLTYDPGMADPYRGSAGAGAQGAGDARINFLTGVENRKPSEAFYPIGSTCRSLSEEYGY